MNKIVTLFIGILFTCTSLLAIEKEEISSLMENNINTATNILQNNKQLSVAEKSKLIFPLFEGIFDYDLMTKLSLGKENWVLMSDDQRVEFTQKFIEHLKKSFMDKLDYYTDEKLHMLGIKDIKTRVWLETELVGSKDTYEIIYKFYKSKNGWLIYDVNIVGVSLLQTYRVQFENALVNGTYAALLSKLDKK